MILTREQALKGTKRTFENITLPDLDGELRLASISAGTGFRIRSLQARAAKGEDVERELVLAFILGCIVGTDDAPLFDESSASQWLDTASPGLIQALVNRAAKMAGAPVVPLGNSEGSPSAA